MQSSHLANKTYTPQNKLDTRYRKKIFRFIGILFLIKIILAFALELGNDEAYYWLYSQHLQWNYFDHPPMVAIWIRIFTANLFVEQYEGFIRLGSVIGCVLSSCFLFWTASLLHSEKAGWFAVVLYNISFYSAITAGLYILPDSPQMVFWTLALFSIAGITKYEDNWSLWLLFGAVAGFCIMSKVHGVFLWIGFGGYILFQKTSWLKKAQLYIALLLTVIIISPIFLWNVKYDFITFRFHSSRIDVGELAFQGKYFLKELGSQVGFNNPINFFIVFFAIIAFYRKRIQFQPALAIFNFVGLPLVFLLFFISLFRNVTLPHWSGPAYVSLMPVAAVWLAEQSEQSFPNILRWGFGIFLLAYLGYSLAMNFYPGTYGSQQLESFGRGDITLDMYGWRKASIEFDSLYNDDVAKNKMPPNAAMVTTHWWGAHVEYYFARPLGLEMIGMGRPQQLNEYLWTNKWRQTETDLNSAYCVIPTDDRYYLPSDFFQTSELAITIDIKRSGKSAHRFRVYRLRVLKKDVPSVK